MTAPDLDLGNIDFGGEPPKADPKPKTTTRKTTGNPPGRPGRDAKLKELREEIKGFLFLLNLGIMTRDVHEVYDERTEELLGYASCMSVYVEIDKKGLPALTAQGGALVDAIANIVIDSPFMMKILNGGDAVGKWMMLAMALQPGVMTVISNHSFRRVPNDVSPPIPE